MKNLLPFFLGAASSAAIFSAYLLVNRGGADSTWDPLSPHAADHKAASVIQDRLPDRANRIRKPSDVKSTPDPAAQTIELLEKLAVTNPGIIEKLNLSLFDSELNPQMENWKILGLDKEEATRIGDRIKHVMETVRKQELEKHSVLQQSDNSVRLALPALDKKASEQRIEDIESSFSGSLDPALSKVLAKKYIDSNPATCGGITGRNRIVTVSMTSEETFKKTGRQFVMDIRTIYEGAAIKDASENLDSYTASKAEILLPSVPAGWSHLFKTTK